MFRKLFSKPERKEGVLAGLKNNPVKKDPVELFLSKNRPNCRLPDKAYDDTYGVFVRRAVQVLKYTGAEDAMIQRMLDELGKMCLYRRGVTLPSNMVAYQLQRYWDIVTFTLLTMYLVRIVSEKCTGVGIQVTQAGEVYTFAPYQDYLHGAFQRIGVVHTDAAVMGTDVLLATRLNVLNDLLFKSPMASQWYGMFPDMLRLLFRHLEGRDEAVEIVFGVTVDRFIESFKNSAPVSSSAPGANGLAPTKLQTFTLPESPASQAAPVMPVPQTSETVVESPPVKQKLTMTPALSAAFAASQKPRSTVEVTAPKTSSQATTATASPKSSQCEKMEQGLGGGVAIGTAAISNAPVKSSQCEKSEQGGANSKLKAGNNKGNSIPFAFKTMAKLKEAKPNNADKENFDCVSAIKNILRDILSKDALFKRVTPISRESGEIADRAAIMIGMSAWRVSVSKQGCDEYKHEILNHIKNNNFCYLNARGGVELNNGEEIVILIGEWIVDECAILDTSLIGDHINVEFDDICLRM